MRWRRRRHRRARKAREREAALRRAMEYLEGVVAAVADVPRFILTLVDEMSRFIAGVVVMMSGLLAAAREVELPDAP